MFTVFGITNALSCSRRPWASASRAGVGARSLPWSIPIRLSVSSRSRIGARSWRSMDTLGGEQTSDGLFNPHVRLVVSHASENAVRRSQARQHTHHLTLGFRVPTNVVPGQRDQVWL